MIEFKCKLKQKGKTKVKSDIEVIDDEGTDYELAYLYVVKLCLRLLDDRDQEFVNLMAKKQREHK